MAASFGFRILPLSLEQRDMTPFVFSVKEKIFHPPVLRVRNNLHHSWRWRFEKGSLLKSQFLSTKYVSVQGVSRKQIRMTEIRMTEPV